MKTTSRLSLAAIVVMGLALGLAGIGWGLPSARRVALLGESLTQCRAALAARTSRELETRRDHAAILAAQPAEEQFDLPRLVRRYLMFSDSPDEPLTLLALAKMRPRQFDFNPRMVEYGGLHVYGVGAVMALAHVLGFGQVSGDVTHYADHPDHIAGLYIAGRLLMVLYNVGIAVLLFLFASSLGGENAVSRISNPQWVGVAAALMWLLSPPSLAFSHIINPHLPAAFYGTLATWLAWRAATVASTRYWLGAAAASGAAVACALNAAMSLLVLPAVAFYTAHAAEKTLKPESQQAGGWSSGFRMFATLCAAVARPLGLALLMAAAFYLALNPYCLANLDVLREELARFRQFRSPLPGVGSLVMFCGGPLPHAIGIVGLGATLFGAATLWQASAAGRALVSYAVVGLLLSAWLAGSDASEALSVRFAMFILPLLCVFVAVALAGPWPRWSRVGAAALIAVAGGCAAAIHLASFTRSPRDDAGEFINRTLPTGSAVVAPKSPGPYEMPAFDFVRLRLVTDPKTPHEFALQLEDSKKPATPVGFELMAGFPDARVQWPTPLSFSGRFARIYRRTASHQ